MGWIGGDVVGVGSELAMSIFYKTRVEDLMTRSWVVCLADDDVRDVATQMREHGTGSAVVLDTEELPIGIVTERDLAYKVVAQPTPAHDRGPLSAGQVMSSPPVTIAPGAFLYTAVGMMTRHRCRRLIVVDEEGRLRGLLSMRDVMRLQTFDSNLIMADVLKARSLDELCLVRDDIDRFMQRLYLADVDGCSLAEVLAALNDTVVRRVIAINEAKMRSVGHPTPACRFAWVSFGSEGRRAQVLRGDQDNGIIIEDAGATQKVLAYYRQLADRVNEDLAVYGFDLCPGGVMAREEKFFGTESAWRQRIATAVRHVHQGREGRYLTIVLDARHVAGVELLVHSLWECMLEEIDRYPPALLALARDAASKTVPLTLLGRFRYEDSGNGRRGINLKKYGMLGILSATKALCVQQHISETEVGSRIRALGRARVLDDDTVDKLVAAYELLMRLRFQASVEAVFEGGDSQLVFFPDEWTEWGREDLKRAFKAVDGLRETIRSRFPVPSR